MAYGQTGSGKTHTMGMSESPASGCHESSGVMPRALDWLDNVKLNDLIAGEQHVASAAAALALLQTGLRRRHTAATNVNAVPSRAYTVLIVTVLWPGKRKASKLRLADLAGSERLPAHGKVISASTSATTGFGPSKDDSPKTCLCDWVGSVQNRKPSGILASGLGSAAEEAQKRIAAEAEAEQLRLQISAAARTVDAGTDAECKQLVNTGTDTECKQSVYTGTDAECKQLVDTGTNFCGNIKPRKLVRKVRAPASAQSAGMDTGKTGACIKPRKLVRKDWASAKPKSK
ncbi:kinesin motor protein cin8, partial [Coemansia sp. RSA 720]